MGPEKHGEVGGTGQAWCAPPILRAHVTAKTALLLAKVLKTTPEFWLNAQMAVDLWHAQAKHR
jgi:hypothetical protein